MVGAKPERRLHQLILEAADRHTPEPEGHRLPQYRLFSMDPAPGRAERPFNPSNRQKGLGVLNRTLPGAQLARAWDHGLMSGLLHPLIGSIPDSRFGARVVGPPTATLSVDQKDAASRDPLSFRHAAGRSARTPRDEAARWLAQCRSHGVLMPVGPAVIVYRQEEGDLIATGILGDLSLRAYAEGQVKPHEKTIVRTRRKMAEYMRSTRMYGNPAVTGHRLDAALKSALMEPTEREPDSAFRTVDGISHQLWVVDGDAADQLCRAIDGALYITDGHHRLAAAALIAEEEGRVEARIPVGVFSTEELRLRSFARCVIDPEFRTDRAIAQLRSENHVEEVGQDEARPGARLEFGAKIGDRYFRIRIPSERVSDDHYDSLDVNLLQELILGPVFGIDDPLRDKRLRFVADLSDTQQTGIEADAWLLPFPVTADDVMAVADSERAMPPKSTWYAPKLPSGLVIRPLDES